MDNQPVALQTIQAYARAAARRVAPHAHQMDATGRTQDDHAAELWASAFALDVRRLRGEGAVDDPIGWVKTHVRTRVIDRIRRLRREVAPESMTQEDGGEMDVPGAQDVGLDVELRQMIDVLRRTMPPDEMALLERVAHHGNVGAAYEPSLGNRGHFYVRVDRARARARRIVEARGRC